MNVIPDNSIVVSDIATNTIKLRVQGGDSVKEVEALGFLASDQFMVKTVKDENEKLELIKSLVKADAFFVFGYGWYPSEVMDFYKEKNAYIGKYKVISWSDPNHYNIEEK
ncbi:hypothetical protein ECA3403 [Pectobacterium atrosepticum SCRI1043]|uniref:Uncharacterized protein n=1 Tax=Pectobacterium atrosepticum (strain SCRI 1043 / ATCC BAA-672) TaxID=218491 RepID=Q6D1P2_PECAS|nr:MULTISPECIES: hypothetical protein [Pectobacterium]AVT59980.1 putative RhsCo3 immunity protein [Pectobacterium versatile]KGA31028.1 hypothetical protein KS43_19865 [Pectobacterium odoriferum]MBQ4792350.1 hypothetical protein [Pectobacterium versatile]MCA6939563.1 hypothetical protein [Pectobacterium versatile]MCA6980778.1 hypothetical protein [Pectobacterium atrosepticum]